jgi:hypothetical protein
MKRLAALGLAGAALGLGAESLARRLELVDATPRLTPHGEPEWKLLRLGELRAQRLLPQTVLLGASVLDADIDPDVVQRSAPELGQVFNACLGGSETMSLAAWWQILRREITPERAAIEVHPLMVHGQTSLMAASVNEALGRLEPRRSAPVAPQVASTGLRPRDFGRGRLNAAVRARSQGTALRTDRNLPNGHLHRFRDVHFDEGIRTLPVDWYEAIGIDPSPNPDVQQYVDFASAVKADVGDVMLVVSPLALHSTSSTAGGYDSYVEYGDSIVAECPALGFPVLDLRPYFTSFVDFADPFHLRSWAIRRASHLVAVALVEAFGSGRST